MNVYLDLGDPGGRDFGMRGIWVRGGKWGDQFTSNLGTRWTGSYHSKEGANMGKDGEVETTVYGKIVQIKQDRMIPVFRCVVIETLVAQYCGMTSAAGVKRYIRFRELRPLEAWE
jgi:hypothetical protein